MPRFGFDLPGPDDIDIPNMPFRVTPEQVDALADALLLGIVGVFLISRQAQGKPMIPAAVVDVSKAGMAAGAEALKGIGEIVPF